jgi:hypothetical protein
MNTATIPFLDPPYEIFEFQPARPARFIVTGFKVGRIRISPRWPGAPPEKEVVAVRLFIDPKTKPTYPPYWDITPSRLVHQLAGMLAAGIPAGMALEIERDIPGPKAHFSVRWVPVA